MGDTGSSADYQNSALDEFRVNWQRELQVQNEPAREQPNEVDEQQQSPLGLNDIEAQARAESLYRTAVDLEQRGKVYDALAYYRKATQIVPDIEFRFYEQQKLNYDANKKYHNLPNDFAKQLDLNHTDAKEDIDVDLIDGLYDKFQRDVACEDIYGGKMLLNSRDTSVISTSHNMHISDLPPEIMMNILRWVVSSQLDMHSLEQFAAVCKGCYIYGRDEELWRLACSKVWGHNVGTLEGLEDGLSYGSWRDMFIRRERVLFSGCYISKTTYLRMGENSFQDQFYRPLQLVEYYRYIRFLPDGKVLMMTSADEPAQGVNKLKQLYTSRPDVLRGRYRLFGNIVTLILQKSQSRPAFAQRHRRGSMMPGDEEANNTQYVIELRILNNSKRQFGQLAWTKYTLVQRRNKIESSSEFDLTAAKYPPLWFSPVKSYHLDADAPLA
ncbi:LOW QUALITY PROTEIN: F-box only protein 9 [Drosophila sulfurigaster albostrigata]|uniref:LOW QUALITY PROTEIN: F-box only protein 9 n=1 Tax=Drosophila sulfurigaster albostrigata TaxID=89887 RepID=UPI002D219FB5|nr:LOW QUALITY PROTEIN: F-box only protein 9 [Drosophila sulfurigaster albostrigata]